jgi:hypothetical protein
LSFRCWVAVRNNPSYDINIICFNTLRNGEKIKNGLSSSTEVDHLKTWVSQIFRQMVRGTQRGVSGRPTPLCFLEMW